MADIAHDTLGRNFNSGVSRAKPGNASYLRLYGAEAASYTNRARSVTAASDLATDRITSADALRGFAMFWIIAGDAFAWSLHDLASR